MSEEFCFVIMPFSDNLKPVYEDAIKLAVEDAKLRCIRVDEVSGTGNIVRRIVEHIHEARVIVADLTGRNANVFYELGIAHALGNNVIVLAQDIRADVPFDLGPYKVIQYGTGWGADRALRQSLLREILSLAEWSKGPSNPVQDFLPPDARPVPFGKYRTQEEALELALTEKKTAEEAARRVQHDLEGRLTQAQAELHEALAQKTAAAEAAQAAQRKQQELERQLDTLRRETASLQQLKSLMESVFEAAGQEMPDLAQVDFDAEANRLLEELRASTAKQTSGQNQTRIKFKPIGKSETNKGPGQ